ncbi:MAG TPA: SMP-30/gluconolactonase/LRE family protein [Fimbriiglobus sp.]|jgi:gluconolactonase
MLRRLSAFAAVVTLVFPAAGQEPERKLVVLDPGFAAVIDPNAKIERLAGDFIWTEGPVWDKKAKRILFSDIPNNRICSWSESGGVKDFLKPSGYTGTEKFTGKEPGSNGLTFDKSGTLTLCQHGDRRIAKLVDGKFVTLADKYEGKRLNSPNDLVFDANGNLYFTDPPYGLPGIEKDPKKELDFQGVYRLTPDGKLTLLTKELSRPNGLALTPDRKFLIVGNSDPDKAFWMEYPLNADGTLGKGRVFADVTADVKVAPNKGVPDGMKIDARGNVFASAVNGIYIFSSTGKLLGKIHTSVPTSNLNFGDDGSTLYITANTELLRVKTKTKGQGF